MYYTIRFARANGIRCILNPAPGQPVDLAEVSRVDYFIPNETEAETIAGKPVRSVDEAKACARYFLEQGIARVIITLGVKGALLGADGSFDLIPAYAVQTKDTTGAGDTFIRSFADVPRREGSRKRGDRAGLSLREPVDGRKEWEPRNRSSREQNLRRTSNGRKPQQR